MKRYRITYTLNPSFYNNEATICFNANSEEEARRIFNDVHPRSKLFEWNIISCEEERSDIQNLNNMQLLTTTACDIFAHIGHNVNTTSILFEHNYIQNYACYNKLPNKIAEKLFFDLASILNVSIGKDTVGKYWLVLLHIDNFSNEGRLWVAFTLKNGGSTIRYGVTENGYNVLEVLDFANHLPYLGGIMAENYKDMESLEDVKKLIDNGCSVTGVEGAVGVALLATPIGSATVAGAATGAFLGPAGSLVGAGVGFLFGRHMKHKREREMQKRLYEYKLSLYTKAVQVQNALIEKLKDELNLERSERKYVMELNEKLQDVIRKLRGDLNR